MKRAIAHTGIQINNQRANITTMLLLGSLMIAAFYTFSLYNLISKTVLIGQLEKEASALSSEISSLDSEYLKLSSTITPDKMSKYGLEKGHVSLYITRPQPTAYAPVTHEF